MLAPGHDDGGRHIAGIPAGMRLFFIVGSGGIALPLSGIAQPPATGWHASGMKREGVIYRFNKSCGRESADAAPRESSPSAATWQPRAMPLEAASYGQRITPLVPISSCPR